MDKRIVVSLWAIGLVLAVAGSGSAGERSVLRPPTTLSGVLRNAAEGPIAGLGTFGSATSGGTSVNVKVDAASTGGQHIPGIAVGPNRDVYVVWTAPVGPSVFVTQTATKVFAGMAEAVAFFKTEYAPAGT